MNPIGAAAIAFLCILILAGSRKAATLAMLAGVLFISQRQQVPIGGLNMFSVRFMEIAGFFRVMSRGEFSFRELNSIDWTLIVLYIYTAFVYSVRSTEGQAYIIGNSVDAFLCYFTFRGLVHDAADVESFLESFVYLLVPCALLVIVESMTHRNPYAFEGGGMGNWVRHGRLRCVGTFRNPDLLGTVGATFLSLYIARIFSTEARKTAIIALVSCAIIVWGCNSGGPTSATAGGLVGWALWRLRGRMHLFRRGFVAFIILAAMMMKAPVWYLIARASELTGGDGWHRAFLIDTSVQHLSRWWVAGLPMVETINWFPYAFDTGADITNTFISFGLNAGIGAMAMLIFLLVCAYKTLSRALEVVRLGSPEPGSTELLLWGMGAMLATHIVNWFGITYFDQSYVMWFMQLAAISSVATSCIQGQNHPIPAEAADETEHVEPVAVA